MRLAAVRRHWERLGRRDPLWAVLTDPDKREGGWDLEQFFQSGAEEIAAVLQQARQLGITVTRGRALDFGCGVGRLTQAMAAHFERCDGVDISAPMLRLARRYNRHPERCVYHRNAQPDLTLFADGTFAFVYSTLVLQHMEPSLAKAYIRELVRVLSPGGLLVFQVPSHRAAREPEAGAARTSVTGPLPSTACRARLAAEPSVLSLVAGGQATLKVTVENRSTQVWPALPDASGRHQINLANHWLNADGALVRRDDGRCPLPHDLGPGERFDLLLGITAPPHGGTYWIEIDLVQENVGWFGGEGSETSRVSCRVTGGLPGPMPPLTRQPSTAHAGTPFRERHPRAFGLLRATGLRDLYWAWRRALDRVKTRRDREVRRTIHPLINWWLGRPFAAKMEMHCIPRGEVVALLNGPGLRLLHSDEELVTGGFQSCRYWVYKDQ